MIILGFSTSAWAELPSSGAGGQSPLQTRQQQWPEWTVPEHQPRPDADDDLFYPIWFKGLWTVESSNPDEADDAPLRHQARFERNTTGRIVADRAFNAEAIGRAQFGEQLMRVEDDPSSANRQLALFRGGRSLESKVVGRWQERINDQQFLADELVIQIMRGRGAPRISRIETLTNFKRWVQADDQEDDRAEVQQQPLGGQVPPQIYPEEIYAEQWQARYPGPGETRSASPLSTSHYQLTFKPLQDQA